MDTLYYESVRMTRGEYLTGQSRTTFIWYRAWRAGKLGVFAKRVIGDRMAPCSSDSYNIRSATWKIMSGERGRWARRPFGIEQGVTANGQRGGKWSANPICRTWFKALIASRISIWNENEGAECTDWQNVNSLTLDGAKQVGRSRGFLLLKLAWCEYALIKFWRG